MYSMNRILFDFWGGENNTNGDIERDFREIKPLLKNFRDSHIRVIVWKNGQHM